MADLHHGPRPSTRALVLGALGVVFGDIGTSPLYALKECFDVAHNPHAVAVTPGHVLGVLSLIFWALIAIVSVKYLVFVMRANHHGEGGILSLLSLAVEKVPASTRTAGGLMLAGIFGAALLYGDGIITPAISVLSAVEGLENAVGLNERAVVWIAAAIIVVLFSFQYFGTEKVGAIFGPVTLLWFVVLAGLGIRGLLAHPAVLQALNPVHAFDFLRHGGWHTFLVLGSVFLVVTGGEALYADMGHFGWKPIRHGWFFIVLPALMLNYLGQGALLLDHPEIVAAPDFNPFFMLAPASPWALLPLVCLATAATVIASQALITGTYSLTLQAVQLGCLPRVAIRHTSAHTRGQIYVPIVNWVLMLACVALVFGFGSSTRLAAAYGIAVTLTMLITTGLFAWAARSQWNWSLAKILPFTVVIVVIEGSFFAANAVKIADGGWFPLAVGLLLFTLMTTWRRGRRLIIEQQADLALTQEDFIASMGLGGRHAPFRAPGTAVFLAGTKGRTPVALLHNLKHNHVLHERVIFLTVVTDNAPLVPREKQVELETLAEGFYRLTAHYGFMQEPDLPQLLRRARNIHDFHCDADSVTFFLGRETIVPSPGTGMALWREHLFAFISRLAQPPAHFFRIPVGRVIELGVRVKL